jgi:hypothetical protein
MTAIEEKEKQATRIAGDAGSEQIANFDGLNRMQVPELPVVTLKHIHRTRIIGISTSRTLFWNAYVPRCVASSISNRRLIVV